MPFAKLAGTTTAGRCLPTKRPDARMARLAAPGGASAAMPRPVMFLLHYLREFFEVANTPLPLLLPEPNGSVEKVGVRLGSEGGGLAAA